MQSTGLVGELRTNEGALAQLRQRLANTTERVEQIEQEKLKLEADGRQYRGQLDDARDRAETDRQLAQEIAIKVESRRTSKQSASVSLTRLATQRSQLEQRERTLLEQVAATMEPSETEASELEGPPGTPFERGASAERGASRRGNKR